METSRVRWLSLRALCWATAALVVLMHAAGSQGAGDPAAKAAMACQKVILKAGRTFAAKKLQSLETCVDAAFTCAPLVPSDTACRTRAGAACVKAFARIASEQTKLVAAIDKKCADASIAFGTLWKGEGLALNALTTECITLGLTGLRTLADYEECLRRQHECRVEDMLRFEAPRAEELFGLLDPPVSVRSTFCPTTAPTPSGAVTPTGGGATPTGSTTIIGSTPSATAGTPTVVATASPTLVASATATLTVTPTPTDIPTATQTATPSTTTTPTRTATPTPTATRTTTVTATPTVTGTATAITTPSSTSTATPTATPTPSATTTPTPTATPTCGNGVVDPGETCDGNCPICAPNAVTCYGSSSGSAATCNLVCNPPILSCSGTISDACCPFQSPGNECGSASDADCSGSSWNYVRFPNINYAAGCDVIRVYGIQPGGSYLFTTCAPPAVAATTGDPQITSVVDNLATSYAVANDDCISPSALPNLAGWNCLNDTGAQYATCSSNNSGGFIVSAGGAFRVDVTVCAVAGGGGTAPFYVWYNAPTVPNPG